MHDRKGDTKWHRVAYKPSAYNEITIKKEVIRIMKKMTKATSLVLGLALSAGLLTGCGTTSENTVETTGMADGTETISETISETITAEPVEVSTVTWWSGDSHNKDLMEKLIKDFNETTGREKGINIEYKVIGGDGAAQAVELALKSGAGPDLFTKGDTNVMAQEGTILAIEDLPGGDEILATYGDAIPYSFTSGGKTYRVPVGATTRGLVYNKDMFKAAGIVDENGEAKPPVTYEELREDAKKLTDESARKYGIIFPLKWGAWFDSDVGSNAAQQTTEFLYYNYDKGEYDYSGMKPVVEAMAGIYSDGSVYPGADSVDNDSARALFAEGMIGMKFAYSFDVGVLTDQFPAKCDWGVAPLPALDENERYSQYMVYNESPFINAKTEVPLEKIAEVYKFIVSDEVAIERYKAGYDIPWNWDIVKDVQLNEGVSPAFAEFSKMVAISQTEDYRLKVDLGGEESAKDTLIPFIKGDKSLDGLDAAFEEINKRYNNGVDRYYEANADKKEADYAEAVVPGYTRNKVSLDDMDK